jgi:hypothetical protein
MSARKLPVYETANFNFSLLGFSLLIFLAVVLRRWYQRREIALLYGPDRTAYNASFYAALAHIVTLAVGAVVVSIVADNLINGFPIVFKLWLILPIISTLASIYLLLRTVGVWKHKLFAGVWARTRFTIVTLCALSMTWFYFFWNILGFQYMV